MGYLPAHGFVTEVKIHTVRDLNIEERARSVDRQDLEDLRGP